MTLIAIQALVNDLVRDKDQVISSLALDEAINQAVLRYSGDCPREVVVDQVSELGGAVLDLPQGWDPTLSQLHAIEYPIDEVPASELDLGDVRFRNKPTGMVLALPIEITAGDSVRLTYTQRHEVDGTTDTVPETHRYAVACWAASIVCGQLASYYATEGASTISADVADHQGKTERYRARARDLAGQYTSRLGVNDKRPASAAAVASMQGKDSYGGNRLFHARRYQR